MRLALLVLCWCSASIAVTVLSGLHSLASLYRQFRAEKWLPRTHSSSLSHGCGKAWHGLTRLLLNCRLWNGVEVLICSFALVAVFVWVRIFWRRYDLMNSQRPFPWLDVEFKDVTDVECSQPAGVSPVLCVEWWELRCTLICTVMSTWTLLSWSTCNKNSSLCRTWRVCRLLDAKSKKREVHTMSMDLCNGCVRAALKKMFAVVAVFLVCFPAALVVTLPSEPYGGHSPAGHRPVQHYPLMISCPEPEALTRNITQFIRNRNRPPVETKERMTVTSIANLMAEGILQRWKRAELELAEVGGGGATFVPVFFVDDPTSPKTKRDLECVRQHFPTVRVLSDSNVMDYFPELLSDPGVQLGPFRPLPGRWAWTLVQVLQLVAVSDEHSRPAVGYVRSSNRDNIQPKSSNNSLSGDIWFVEPDVGWTDGATLPELLLYAYATSKSVVAASSGQSSVDYIGPSHCGVEDNSAAFWNSKGEWETRGFKEAVESHFREERGAQESVGRWHCQLQISMLSQRMRELLTADILQGRVAYCETHGPTLAKINNCGVGTMPREVLSPRFLKWEKVTSDLWNEYRRSTPQEQQRGAPPGQFYHSLKF